MHIFRLSVLLVSGVVVAGCSDSDGGLNNSSGNHNLNVNLNDNTNTNANDNANTNTNDNDNDNDNGNLNTNTNTNNNSNSNSNTNNNPVCGDGVLEGLEACDDGNTTDCDGCRGDCSATETGCGDGFLCGSEACDDGNTTDCDGCRGDCSAAETGCGDGFLCGNEQCDEGTSNCDTAGCTCSTTCDLPGDPCGYPLNGVWFEIDYSSAYTSTNPAWTFSNTPGWGEPQWAPSGSSWPEVWDLYSNISVHSDPVGSTLAELGSSSELQIMLGLGSMISYSYASVCVEGRSVSTSSSVTFDVYNPLNSCGDTASMSNDWLSFHPTGINLATCLIPGNDFQAIRFDTTGGSSHLGIIRVRVILHDAVY